ncbi:peptidylprolyl isomerase [Paenibacillus larvae]|uniref:peptidylprolyl isomerase n=1 Tax=Paenibacillus larvae TaxID=1464 RepID=UPI00040947D0|nr:peptidylprolyl isomerase [Paenibacillus larvae]AVG14197.1 peptidylprolyl isomerase PrsA [Paenibacillus larvae subsp. larvae DSM 25430]MDR5567862.1 peptidylprolyl isomerase [Paenibacillus larvae]MDR5594133.1 peptidylprolyl isomerase [Paenibacillus larvae]
MQQNKPRILNKWILALITVILTVSVLSGCGKDKGDKEVVATYKENGKVTRGELNKLIGMNNIFNPAYKQFAEDPAYQQSMLKQIIMFKEAEAKADDAAKKEADKKVQDQMKQMKQILDQQEGGADKVLKDEKMELKDIENILKQNFYASKEFEKQVTEDETKKAYDENLAQEPNAYEVEDVSHILIGLKDLEGKDLRNKDEAKTRALEVKGKLEKGEDFAALAKEYSDDPGSKDKGGKYEKVDYSQMMQFVEPFKQAAWSLEENKISDPVETDYGYHIMKVENRKKQTYDEVKDQIRSQLSQKKMRDYIEQEVPKLIETNNLPKPSEQPSPTPAPSGSPAPSAEPTATPAP